VERKSVLFGSRLSSLTLISYLRVMKLSVYWNRNILNCTYGLP